MIFLDAIASPFERFPITGIAVVLMAVICVIGLTLAVFALFQRFSEKKDEKKEETP